MSEVWHETWYIVSDPGHWGAEIIMDYTFFAANAIPAYLIGRWRLRVHDRKTHGVKGSV